MDYIENQHNKLAPAIRTFIIELIAVTNGYLNENYYSLDTIKQNLIVEFVSMEDGSKQLCAHLEKDYEYNLFRNLFNQDHLNSFYHYTSFETLFKIIQSGKIRLSSLAGLNDKSEIDLVNRYMGIKSSNPYNYITMLYSNAHFIFCCSEKKDDLNQWRLYGDNCMGVMLKFEIDKYSNPFKNLLVSKISYDLKHFDIIKQWFSKFKNEFQISFGFRQIDYWKFFYKEKDYADECEVRVVVKNLKDQNHQIFNEEFYINRNNVVAPFIEIDCFPPESSFITLSEIILGPKFIESDINITQIQHMINKRYKNFHPNIVKSSINHFR